MQQLVTFDQVPAQCMEEASREGKLLSQKRLKIRFLRKLWTEYKLRYEKPDVDNDISTRLSANLIIAMR